MGNHEFCVECGEDDFHLQRDCNPTVKAAYQKKLKVDREKREVACQAIYKRLTLAGLEFDKDEYGNAIVRPWQKSEGPVAESVMLFPNGTFLAFHDGEQIPDLTRNLLCDHLRMLLVTKRVTGETQLTNSQGTIPVRMAIPVKGNDNG